MRLDGKVALVTGGSRGIGAAISRKLAASGCAVFINYVEREAPALALAGELRGAGAEVETVRADVTDDAETAALLERVGARHGRLDLLIHNAAAAVFRPLGEATPAHWDFTLDKNVRALAGLARHATPLMSGRGARLIALSNRMAVAHHHGSGLFGAAKAALESLVRALAVELAPHGIVVNAVRPGTVATDVLKTRPQYAEALAHEAAHSPWRRVTTVEDVANAVALLCLDEAAWICGQTLVVDGGWSNTR